MKRISVLHACLMALVLLFTACAKPGNPENPDSGEPTQQTEATPTPVSEKVTEQTDYVTEQWIAVDIPFTANAKVKKAFDASIDVTFKNRTSGTTLVMPGFWDGDTNWKVRFAPTECGVWEYSVKATGTDIGLDGISGTLASNPYTGDLEIYKRGFVRTEENTRYFVYNDGTPFFYLADTHWNFLNEEFDSAGFNNAGIKTDSHFKYIVDRRVAQGFTVYQSEPLSAPFDTSDGSISAGDVKGFNEADVRFKYIAEKGMLHANAQLLFPSEVTNAFRDNVRELTRYWVARYAAYPVLWTLGQEVDDATNQKYPMLTSVYVVMCKYLSELDPYKHPTSAHQLNTSSIGCAGGVKVAPVDGGYNNYDATKNERTGTNKQSAFYNAVGHTWWAAQWRPCVDQQYNFDMPKDYWENGKNKPTVDFEARYDYLYTKEFGARTQAWIAMLCGMCGVAYGGGDMWAYMSTYAQDSDGNDGVDVITVKDKKIKWGELINAPISDQMTRLRGFFEAVGWWKLEPDFDYGNAYKAGGDDTVFYAAAHAGNDVYVVYFYNRTVNASGTVEGLDAAATYTAQWFNTVTGEYTLISDSVQGANYTVTNKPVAQDMVLLLTKN